MIERGVDWPCEVHRNYSEVNLGCRQRVSSGLDWVFSQVEDAIVLEDDCLPAPSFFGFCSELLERYRQDERVVHIGGCNIAAPYSKTRSSYRFSRHAWIWGWATWSRAWKNYDFNMATWDQRLDVLRSTFASRWEAQYWISTFESCRQDLEKANTWGFPWMYTCRSLGGLSILPSSNLVENIGFDSESTHPFLNAEKLSVPTESVAALRHPRRCAVSAYADELVSRLYANCDLSIIGNLKSCLRILRKRLR
jgi:hypothetical protein